MPTFQITGVINKYFTARVFGESKEDALDILNDHLHGVPSDAVEIDLDNEDYSTDEDVKEV